VGSVARGGKGDLYMYLPMCVGAYN
jgi:hypothetical protein